MHFRQWNGTSMWRRCLFDPVSIKGRRRKTTAGGSVSLLPLVSTKASDVTFPGALLSQRQLSFWLKWMASNHRVLGKNNIILAKIY